MKNAALWLIFYEVGEDRRRVVLRTVIDEMQLKPSVARERLCERSEIEPLGFFGVWHHECDNFRGFVTARSTLRDFAEFSHIANPKQ
jgi:hypothetical protein